MTTIPPTELVAAALGCHTDSLNARAPRFTLERQFVDRIDDAGAGEAVKHLWRLVCVK